VAYDKQKEKIKQYLRTGELDNAFLEATVPKCSALLENNIQGSHAVGRIYF